MFKKMKVLVIMMLTAVMLVGVCAPVSTLSIQAATTKKAQNAKAVKAYKKMLAKKKLTWGSGTADLTKNMKFAIVDVDNNGVKDLVLKNSLASYAAGYYRVYTYVNGKVKLIDTINDKPVIYKNGIIRIDYAHTGDYAKSYYTIKKQKLNLVLSMGGVDTEANLPVAKDKAVKIKMFGNTVYMYSFQINNDTCTYAQYKAQLKKLVGSTTQIKYSFKNNTSKNRTTYLK